MPLFASSSTNSKFTQNSLLGCQNMSHHLPNIIRDAALRATISILAKA